MLARDSGLWPCNVETDALAVVKRLVSQCHLVVAHSAGIEPQQAIKKKIRLLILDEKEPYLTI